MQQQQDQVVLSNFCGAKVVIERAALVDYTKWRLTHLRALADLLAGQDPSCNAINVNTLELNRALTDEICELVPIIAGPK